MTIITVICQFCHDELYTKDGGGVTGTSHGICTHCERLSEVQQQRVYHETIRREQTRINETQRRMR